MRPGPECSEGTTSSLKVLNSVDSVGQVVDYSAPSLKSLLSIRATISLFQSAKNLNFNTVFAYWYSTTGSRNLRCANVYRSPKQTIKFQILPSINFVQADYATRIARSQTC